MRSNRSCEAALIWNLGASVLCGMLSLLPHKMVWGAEQEQHGLAWQAIEQVAYDDNLYRLSSALMATPGVLGPGRNITDYINSAGLDVSGRWTLGRQGVELALQIEDDLYAHNSSLNHVSGGGNLLWSWHATDGISGRFGTNYSRSLAAFANTLFYAKDLVSVSSYFTDARFEVAHRWALVGGAKASDISHQNPLRQGDNYHSYSGDAGVEYKTPSDNVIGWDYSYSRARFDQQTVPAGAPLNRDFNEHTESVRFSYALTAKTSAQGDIGLLNRSYPKGNVGNVSGDVWHLSLQWQPGVKTQLKLAGWRELRAYVDAQSNYFIANGFRLTPAWTPTAKIAVSLEESWEDQRFIGSTASTIAVPRRDKVESATAMMTYKPWVRFQVSASYRLERRTSNQADLPYHDNLASLNFQYSR